jgi:hypothetical protein
MARLGYKYSTPPGLKTYDLLVRVVSFRVDVKIEKKSRADRLLRQDQQKVGDKLRISNRTSETPH